MSQTLYIWIGIDMASPSADWVTSDGRMGQGLDTVSRIDADQIIVVLPGQWVRSLSIDLPDMPTKDRFAAAQFAVEDDSALPLSQQHFVMDNASTARLIMVKKMQGLLAELKPYGLDPDCVCADYDLLEPSLGSVAMYSRVITPGALGYTVDDEWADPQTAVSRFDSLTSLLPHIGAPRFNLRQGEFAKRRAFLSASEGAFRKMAVMAGLCVCVGIMALIQTSLQSRALNLQATEWRQEAQRLYAQATGQASPDRPARVLAQSLSQKTSRDVGVLVLSAAFFDIVAAVEGVSIETLSYDAQNAQLSLRLTYPDFEATERLAEKARSNNAGFVPGGVRSRDGQLVGDAVFTLEAQP